MTSTFFMPSVNIMGAGCLQEAMVALKGHGFRKALIVTDAVLSKLGVAARIQAQLAGQQIASVVFDGTQPNPTVGNVRAGLAQLKAEQCDFVISLGGGSPHDCAKGIALCATNGGEIADYEGVDRSAKPQLPLVAINTTAGTASEMTRFCIITDETRHIKMAIVDRNVTPILSVNDPELMLAKPKGLTAATGMDALTHAVEAYVSTAATPITDACALKAVELIARHLRTAVAQASAHMQLGASTLTLATRADCPPPAHRREPRRRPERPRADGLCAVPGGHGVQQRIAGLCACHGTPTGRLL